MDSEPRPSPDGDRSFGDRLAARVRPRGTARRARRCAGQSAGSPPRPRGSGGRSGCRRWAGGDSIAPTAPTSASSRCDRRSSTGRGPTRASEEATPTAAVLEGDPKLAALAKLVGRPAPGPARVPSPPPRRGLPLAAARRGSTTAGPSTSPGAIAAGLRATLDATPPAEPAVRRRERRSDPGGRAGTGDPPADTLPPDLVALRDALARTGRLPPRPSTFRASDAPGHPEPPPGGRRAERPGSGSSPVNPPRGPAAWLDHGERWRWRITDADVSGSTVVMDRVHATADRGRAMTFPSVSGVVQPRHAVVSRVPDGELDPRTDAVAEPVVRRAMSDQSTSDERDRPAVRPHSVTISRLPHSRLADTAGELDRDLRIGGSTVARVAGPVVRRAVTDPSTSGADQRERPTVRPGSVATSRLTLAHGDEVDPRPRIAAAPDTGVAGPVVRRALSKGAAPSARQQPTVPHSVVISRLPHATHRQPDSTRPIDATTNTRVTGAVMRRAAISRLPHATDRGIESNQRIDATTDTRVAGPVVRRTVSDDAATGRGGAMSAEPDADRRVHPATDTRVAGPVMRSTVSDHSTPSARQQPTVRPHSIVITRLPHATHRQPEPTQLIDATTDRADGALTGELADRRVHPETDSRVAGPVVRSTVSHHSTPSGRQQPTVRPHSIAVSRLPHATRRHPDSNPRIDATTDRADGAGPVVRRAMSDDAATDRAITTAEPDADGRAHRPTDTRVSDHSTPTRGSSQPCDHTASPSPASPTPPNANPTPPDSSTRRPTEPTAPSPANSPTGESNWRPTPASLGPVMRSTLSEHSRPSELAAAHRATTQHRHLPPPPRHPTPTRLQPTHRRDDRPSRQRRTRRPASPPGERQPRRRPRAPPGLRPLDTDRTAAANRATTQHRHLPHPPPAHQRGDRHRRRRPSGPPHDVRPLDTERAAAANRATTQHRHLPPSPRAPPSHRRRARSRRRRGLRIWAGAAGDRACPWRSSECGGADGRGADAGRGAAIWARSVSESGTNRAQKRGVERIAPRSGGRLRRRPEVFAAELRPPPRRAAAADPRRLPAAGDGDRRRPAGARLDRRGVAPGAGQASASGPPRPATRSTSPRRAAGRGHRPRADARRPPVAASPGSSTTTTTAPRSARPSRSRRSCAARRSCPARRPRRRRRRRPPLAASDHRRRHGGDDHRGELDHVGSHRRRAVGRPTVPPDQRRPRRVAAGRRRHHRRDRADHASRRRRPAAAAGAAGAARRRPVRAHPRAARGPHHPRARTPRRPLPRRFLMASSLPQLQKAYLEVETGARIECMFNPATFSFSQANRWESDQIPGKATPSMRYAGGEGGSFSLSLVFDTTAAGTAVTAYTNKLLKLMDVDTTLAGYDAERSNGRPPWVKFHWGTSLHSFKAVVKSIDVGFTYFSSEGLPLRANVEHEPRAVRARRQLGPAEPDVGHAEAEPHPPGAGRRHARPHLGPLLRRPDAVARHRRRQRHRRPARPAARPPAGHPGAGRLTCRPARVLVAAPTIKVNGAEIPAARLRRHRRPARVAARSRCRASSRCASATPTSRSSTAPRYVVGSRDRGQLPRPPPAR